jgi:predicted nucleic acid-binding protein
MDLLPLLRRMFGDIMIPEAVARELDQGYEFLGDWRPLAQSFIHVVSGERSPLANQLLLSLHAGEAEAISLAVDRSATLFLCDDLSARRLAIHHGLKVTGTLGILVRAKQLGLLTSIRPYLDALRSKIGFWFTDELYAKIRYLAGE